MTDQQLQAALRAGAEGLYALESGTGLLLAHGTWPAREDFRCFIHVAGSNTSADTELASIDWEAAIAALDAGECPSSGGEANAPGQSVTPKITQSTLAAMIGVSRENVNRALAALALDGSIRLEGGRYVLVDEARLRREAAQGWPLGLRRDRRTDPRTP